MSNLLVGQDATFDNLLPRAPQGDLAFLEYSILHWLHHVKSLPDNDIAMAPDFRHILKLSLEILRNENHHGSGPVGYDVNLEDEDRSEENSWRLIGLALDAQNTSLAFGRCPQVLEQTNLDSPRQSFPESSVMDTDADTQSLSTSSGMPEDFMREETPDQLPATLVKLAACRLAIETAIDQPRANQGLLLSAYGARPFKCPIVACRRFLHGFSKSKERDSHVRSHDRFKCEEMKCDYRLLGFSSVGALKTHTSLCHGNSFGQITFPNIQPQSIWESLEIAIDKEDCLALEHLCIEAKSIPKRPKGFVLRALQKKSFAAAHIIIEHLGSAEELRFRDTKGIVDALSCSAGCGDLDLFRKIMPYYEDVVEPFINSAELAAKEGHEEIVLVVLDKCYAEILASKLQDIIVAALKSGHENIVTLLLRYGNTSVGSRVLSSAIQYGRRSSVKELLQRIDIPKSQKWNDVRSALLENVDSAVEVCLKKRRGDVLADGSTVGKKLQYAASKGNSTEVLELVGRGADINNAGSGLGTAISAAAKENQTEMVRLLLDKGADPNIHDGRNALQQAAFRGSVEIVLLFLENGAIIHPDPPQLNYFRPKNNSKTTDALQAASLGGSEDIVKLLLERGAMIQAKMPENGSALYFAALEGHKTIVELLIDHGADVNIQGGHYGSALQAASYHNYQEVVQLLLGHGADINILGGQFGNTLQAAIEKDHKEIVKLLLDYGADINIQGRNWGSALQAASAWGHKEIVQLLLEHGANVNIQGGDWCSALQAALARGHKEIVRLLLDHGADVNVQGGEGSALQAEGIALQAASRQGCKEVVRLLLDHGADVNRQGGQFGSALQAASWGCFSEIVEMLLEHGADVNIRGGQHGSALQAAIKQGHVEIFRTLLDH